MTRGVLGLVLAAAALGGALAGGYVLGTDASVSEGEAADVKDAAFEGAYESEREQSARLARTRGQRRGESEGSRDGRADGLASGGQAGEKEAESQLAALEAEEAAAASEPTATEEPEPLICDGAIADDAHYAACLEQSGSAPPPGFP